MPLDAIYSDAPFLNVANERELFQVLEGRDRVLSLAGHLHLVEQKFFTEEDGWMGAEPLHHITTSAVSGNWWGGPKDERGIPVTTQRDGTPNGYHIFTFDGNTYSQRLKAAHRSPDFQIRISSPKGIMSPKKVAHTEIVVNVFNGNEKSTVEYRIDDREYVKMSQRFDMDPFIDYAESSTHIWTAMMPTDLPDGIHVLQVRTTDQYGQTYTAHRIFRIQ